jgi:hypothetical protein
VVWAAEFGAHKQFRKGSRSVQQEVSYLVLTVEGQKAFQMYRTSYQDELKLYREQYENIQKLKDWIFANISPHYQNR